MLGPFSPWWLQGVLRIKQHPTNSACNKLTIVSNTFCPVPNVPVTTRILTLFKYGTPDLNLHLPLFTLDLLEGDFERIPILMGFIAMNKLKNMFWNFSRHQTWSNSKFRGLKTPGKPSWSGAEDSSKYLWSTYPLSNLHPSRNKGSTIAGLKGKRRDIM